MELETFNRGYTFGVKFRPGFKHKMLYNQGSCGRFVYNKLLETFKDEYYTKGYVNCTCGRIGAWYAEQRKQTPFLRDTASYVTRETLFALGRH